jgi:hypothetical protein
MLEALEFSQVAAVVESEARARAFSYAKKTHVEVTNSHALNDLLQMQEQRRCGLNGARRRRLCCCGRKLEPREASAFNFIGGVGLGVVRVRGQRMKGHRTGNSYL